LEKVVGLFDAAGFELVRAVSVAEIVASRFPGAATHNQHAWTLHLERR
jgi:DNA-binding protein